MPRSHCALLMALAMACAVAAEQPPAGVLALSGGKRVVLADPASGRTAAFDVGAVGWLFPAPAGALFAPDLMEGRTAVIDTATWRLVGLMDGVTMPRFGALPDRYLVLAEDVLVVSYPDRAILSRVAAGLEHPWQAAWAEDGGSVVVLERRPDGVDGSQLVAVDLHHRQVVFRNRLTGDVTGMAFSAEMSLLALVDRAARAVRLVTVVDQSPVGAVPTPGEPRDVAFVADQSVLAVALATENGGELQIVALTRSGSSLRPKPRATLPLDAQPVRLAVAPDGRHLAVVLADGRIVVVDTRRARIVTTIATGLEPRDLVWCDPSRPGPLLPTWSDRGPTGGRPNLEPIR